MALADLANTEYRNLSTTGRRSGEPHEIEIWFGPEHGVVYLLSGGGDRADWVRNLLVDDKVRLRIGAHSWETTPARLPIPKIRIATRVTSPHTPGMG